MRVLLTTRGSTGHVGPLAEFGHAARRAGHDVLVAAQPQHAANVERTGLPFAPLADPPPEAWMPLLGEFGALDFDTAHERMVGEFFAGIDTEAALAPLAALVDDWRPHVVLRESWEFASTLVAEQRGIPLVRVGLGLTSLEEQTIRLAAPALEPERARLGLPLDPAGDRMRAAPCLTTVPEPFDDAGGTEPGAIHRFMHPRSAAQAPPLPADWWAPGDRRPLVYVSFGSVTAGAHLPFFPSLYRAAIEALGGTEARILLTVGEERDHAELGPLPSNVRVERWVGQDEVLPHVAATVTHGGYGSTLGALSTAFRSSSSRCSAATSSPTRPPSRARAPASRWAPTARGAARWTCPRRPRSPDCAPRSSARWQTRPTGSVRRGSPARCASSRRSTRPSTCSRTSPGRVAA